MSFISIYSSDGEPTAVAGAVCRVRIPLLPERISRPDTDPRIALSAQGLTQVESGGDLAIAHATTSPAGAPAPAWESGINRFQGIAFLVLSKTERHYPFLLRERLEHLSGRAGVW
jgi:hypothetical protein